MPLVVRCDVRGSRSSGITGSSPDGVVMDGCGGPVGGCSCGGPVGGCSCGGPVGVVAQVNQGVNHLVGTSQKLMVRVLRIQQQLPLPAQVPAKPEDKAEATSDATPFPSLPPFQV